MLHVGKQENRHQKRRRSKRTEKNDLELAPGVPLETSAEGWRTGGDEAVKAMDAVPSLVKANSKRKGGNQMMARRGRGRQKDFQNREDFSCLGKGRSQRGN